MCVVVGESRNWVSLLTAKAILGLVRVRYSNLPISLLYMVGSARGSPCDLDSCSCGCIGVGQGFAANKPTSWSKSSVYFLWQSDMPSLDLATSKPRKYLSLPRFLILYSNWKSSFAFEVLNARNLRQNFYFNMFNQYSGALFSIFLTNIICHLFFKEDVHVWRVHPIYLLCYNRLYN
jgi:hypothetical protein